MAVAVNDSQKQIDELLNLPQQAWLFGAGISCSAHIPLMLPLTDRVQAILVGGQQADFITIRASLSENSHVEHVLSQVGDLIALASRTRTLKVSVGTAERTRADLEALHSQIQKAIRDTMRWGYEPAHGAAPERIGKLGSPIVTIDDHLAFVRALFRVRRANLDRRPPVALFTTNYDTLLEDALALQRIKASDGFAGGAMAFWSPSHHERQSSPFDTTDEYQARVYKLHGSVDWFLSDEDVVVRRREGAGYPPDDLSRLLIYPQATKYRATQKDPFASLFAAFKSVLTDDGAGILGVCGYSFGDDHVNEEIATALRRRGSRLTVLAFVRQPHEPTLPAGEGLPAILTQWLSSKEAWAQRVVVAGSRGVYHGSLENKFPASHDHPHEWWSFVGLTKLLSEGPKAAP